MLVSATGKAPCQLAPLPVRGRDLAAPSGVALFGGGRFEIARSSTRVGCTPRPVRNSPLPPMRGSQATKRFGDLQEALTLACHADAFASLAMASSEFAMMLMTSSRVALLVLRSFKQAVKPSGSGSRCNSTR